MVTPSPCFPWSAVVDMCDILNFLRARADEDLLPWTAQLEASRCFQKSIAEVEAIALENELLPARYQRNRSLLSSAQQLHLFRSCVAVVGCGGLGGYVLEELARLGVGRIQAIDPDIFEEHNLNRQLLSAPDNLGQPKVAAAAARIARVNPAVNIEPCQEACGLDNGETLLRNAAIVVDCLDSVNDRLDLAEVCASLGVPLVHGAIAGWYGQVCSVFPGDPSLKKIYAQKNQGKGVEQEMGNPSYTPALVASLQVAEVCKLLLSQGTPLRERMLMIDLLDMEFHEISI